MRPGDGSAKAVTRRGLRRARQGRDAAAAALVAERLAARTGDLLDLLARPRGDGPGLLVAAYASLPGEPGTGPLRARLRELGHQVLLPVLLPDHDLDWVHDPTPVSGDHARLHAGTDPLRPAGPRLGPDTVARCDLVLVPALAVDLAGTRLGQGGGSYDRALARVPPPGHRHSGATGRPLVLAVVHDEELLTDVVLPREPHDVGVDGVLTGAGVRLLSRG